MTSLSTTYARWDRFAADSDDGAEPAAPVPVAPVASAPAPDDDASAPLGDVAETKAIKAVFGDHAYKMNLSSTKSMTGHLLGAAGAVEAIASVLAIQNDRIPPTINFETPDPDCDLNYVSDGAETRSVDVAITQNLGFGGHNGALVFKKV